jgi:hypothetical protein
MHLTTMLQIYCNYLTRPSSLCAPSGELEHGCNPDLIHARCSCLAYGIESVRRTLPGDPQSWQRIHGQRFYRFTDHVFTRYVNW